MECQPLATPFISAIGACERLDAIPAFSMQKNGSLRLVAGKFRVSINCSPDEYPRYQPEGHYIELQPGLLKAFTILEPFVGEDASRPWARGILVRDGSAFATNNVVIGQYWLGWKFSFDMNIPDECVREVIRVKKEPIGLTASDRSITFHYNDGRWIRTQLLTTIWPAVEPVLDRPSNATNIPSDFFDGLSYLEPYCDQHRSVHFKDNRTLSTHIDDGQGATYELETPLGPDGTKGRYNLDQLRHLDGLVAVIDFALYPAPATFFSDNATPFRGAIVGMRDL